MQLGDVVLVSIDDHSIKPPQTTTASRRSRGTGLPRSSGTTRGFGQLVFP
jgi:hypothetical protein